MDPEQRSWRGVQHVLAVRLDAVGDVLMTTPALRALKRLQPEPRLTLLTSPCGAELARLIPEVDATLVYRAPWMKPEQEAGPDADLEFVAELRRHRFDAAAIFTVYSQSPLPAALLCHLAGIPRRLAHCRENPYRLLTHWLAETEPHAGVRHEVQRQLDLAAAVGARTPDPRLSLRVPPAAALWARGRLAALGLRLEHPWLAVHPGASAPSRRYPGESFAAAATDLARLGWQILFVGGTQEGELVQAIRAAMRAPSLSIAGETDLAQLAAVIELAPALVGNNSGPAHIAAAVGTPVVQLYALTNPQHTPWLVRQRVLNRDVECRHCYKSVCPQGHHRCLREVKPTEVVAAVTQLIGVPGHTCERDTPPARAPAGGGEKSHEEAFVVRSARG